MNVGRIFGILFLPLLTNFITISILASPAYAESQGLVVSPPFQEAVVNQVGDKVVSLTLTNRTEGTLVLQPTSVDFRSLNDSGGIAFIGSKASDLERKYGLSNWMKMDGNLITIPSGQTRVLTVTIQNLASLAPGGHYGAVLFRVVGSPEDKDQNRVAIEQQLGSLIFLKKIGGEKYGIEIEDVDKPINWRIPKRTLNIKFKNTGNVHLVPRGTVELTTYNGKQIAKANINPESGILLPESSRKYDSKLNGGLLKPGRYLLQVKYRYDGTAQIKTHQEAVYLFDAWFAAAVGILSLSAVTALFFLIRWFWFRKKQRHK